MTPPNAVQAGDVRKPRMKVFRCSDGTLMWTCIQGQAPYGWFDGVGGTISEAWNDFVSCEDDNPTPPPITGDE